MQMPDDDDQYDAEAYADDGEEYGQDEYAQGEYDGAYDEDREAYDDEYDDEYEEEYADEYDDDEESEGEVSFLGSLPGKIILGVVALLLAVLIALLGMKLLKSRDTKEPQEGVQLPAADEETKEPVSIVFAPVEEETPEPTQEPTIEPTEMPTPEPTDTPEPTATPLPIILTNTPTPSPSPTPTLEPTPSPTPSPTPTPEPTAVPELSKGETNRKANLRATASSSGKVKETLKEGEKVTIHEAILDKSGKVWYGLTVDDLATTGWMRDYVVTTEEAIVQPTYTPKPTGTPKAPDEQEGEEDEAPQKAEVTPEPLTQNENAIGSGKTKKDTNVRKVMNGKVLVQLRQNRRVDILSVRMDKKGEIWYEVQPHNSNTIGFVRDYLIRLDDGVELIMPTPTPKPTEEPEEEKTEPEETEKAEEAEETEQPEEESILDRDIIGKAKTKKEANVRVKPVSNGKLVRQLSKGVKLLILEKYQDEKSQIWYEVSTESGNTHGFVRDYLLNITEIDQEREARTYEKE